jgi:AcrR family transcriptional regulator
VFKCTHRRATRYCQRMSTPGQVKDASRTRARILSAAAREFSRDGYQATTVRSIAAAAEVSPNLITRYFGGKEGLFDAVAEIDLGVDRFARGPLETIGERLSDSVVTRWTRLEDGDPLVALLRASGEHAPSAARLAAFLDSESLAPMQRQLEEHGLPPEDAAARARAVDVFLLGVTARFRMLRDEFADSPATRAWIAQSVQRLVSGH